MGQGCQGDEATHASYVSLGRTGGQGLQTHWEHSGEARYKDPELKQA